MPHDINVKTKGASVDPKGQTRGNLYGHNNTTRVSGRGKPVPETNGK